jgi:predicted O-methyltransferase YrrM
MTVDRTVDKTSNNRGDMSAFAENFPHEDFFMQQARKNGAEVGAPDPTVGVSGLWIFDGAPKEATFTSIDSEREHSASAKEIFEEAGISAQRFRLITGNIIEVVGKLADSNYDLMIVRSPEDMVDVVQESYRLLKAGGVLVIDNALDGGKVADPTQRDFETIARRDSIKAIREDSRWSATVLPIGGGALIARKI